MARWKGQSASAERWETEQGYVHKYEVLVIGRAERSGSGIA